MSKSSSKLSKVAKSISAGAALAYLVTSNAVTPGSASAQPKEGQPSPTLQRLEGLQRVEQDRQSAEDAKWRSFSRVDPPARATSVGTPRPVETVAPWFFDALTGGGQPQHLHQKCGFYWPGWKASQDGVRITNTRSCGWDKVAVSCNSLKVSWYRKAWNNHSPKTAYWSKWETPNTSSNSGHETALMVAALCDNIAPSAGKKILHLAPNVDKSSLSPSSTALRANPEILIPDNPQISAVNVGADGKQILQLLGRMGVRTEIWNMCPQTGAIAAYSRFDNLLVLCKASLRNPSLATEAIAHEAVHALQDCLQPGGIEGSASIPLRTLFKTSNGGKIFEDFVNLLRLGFAERPKIVAYLQEQEKSLSPDLFTMEIEAYALEASPETIRMLLEAFRPVCASG